MANGTLPATVERPALPATAIDPATMEKVVVNGDLSKLSPGERLLWYKARCEAAGLDPRTQPFQYLSLQGKLTLYATKAATDQLIGLHRLTVEILDRVHLADLGIYEARCRVTFPDGRHVEDVAALTVKGLGGEGLCNAVMKCVTKAKRRTVLSACGLGMLDETEVDTIPGAQRAAAELPQDAHHAKNLENNTGHGRTGAYAPPADVAAYRQWLAGFVEDVNAKWLDHLTGDDGQIDPRAKELVSTWQVSGHLLKWAKAEGLLQAPDEPRARQADPLVAILWGRDRQALTAEATRYARQCWREALAKLSPPEAEDVPDDQADDGDPDVDYPDEPGASG